MYSLFVGLQKGLIQELAVEDAKVSTLTGPKPTRNHPNRFLVGRLNHSATVSNIIDKSIHDGSQTHDLGLLNPRSNQLSYTYSI